MPHRAPALLTLARPRMLPWLWGALLFGYGLGHWEAGAPLTGPAALGLALLSWTALHAGTMWLNAARDRDEGPLLFGEAAPVPPVARAAGAAALVACLLPAAAAGPTIALCAAANALLAALYSKPRGAWKAHPVLGPLVNMLGYGVFTPLAGIAAAGGQLSARSLLLLGLDALAMGGLAFAAQAFQADEDRRRGDRTLVAARGPAAALGAARALIGLAGLGAMAGAAAGWFPTVCLLGLPLVLWVDRAFARWAAAPEAPAPAAAEGLLRRLAGMTGAVIVVAFADHLIVSALGGPPAGLATRVVPPPLIPLP